MCVKLLFLNKIKKYAYVSCLSNSINVYDVKNSRKWTSFKVLNVSER